MDLPLYVAETRYYRRVLGISWEFGLRLRKRGVLQPDAMLEGERFLYRLSPETLAQNKAAPGNLTAARQRPLGKQLHSR